MRIDVFSDKLTRLQTDLLVVSCFEDIRPLRSLASEVDWLYGGLLSRILMQKRFTGELGKTILLATEGKLQIPKVILIGLGISKSYGYSQFKAISGMLHDITQDLNIHAFAIEVEADTKLGLNPIQLVDAFLGGEASSDREEALEVTFIVKENEKARVLQHYMHNRIRP